MSLRWIVCLSVLFLALPLNAQDSQFGEWISLFNGENTEGWINAKPDQGHHKGPNRWTVEDGALTNIKGGVNDVCTTAEFDNFELELSYRFPERKNEGFRGNSGIYLRGQVEVQLFDSYGVEDPKPHDVGSIYGAAPAMRCPQNPPGEWNKMVIRNIGHRITVYHNGQLVQDNVHRAEATPGSMSKHPKSGRKLDNVTGPIMFQGDHTKVWFKNIRIRKLCSPTSGWKSIFNGKDVSQFHTHGKKAVGDSWTVTEDGALTNTKWGSDGKDIWTNGEYGDFLVHYEYRVDPDEEGGNSGFYLRNQWEIQIFKDQAIEGGSGRHRDGALYSKRAPSKLARHAPRLWNHIDARVQGMKIWVWQNGVLIHDAVELDTRTDNHDEPTKEWSKGPFKLQGDHGRVWFANIYIKELPREEKAEAARL